MPTRRETGAGAGYAVPASLSRLLAECDVTAYQSSGPGGQHKNRTMTAVRLRHRPTGIVVIGRRERSQRQNLRAALGRLRERLERLTHRPPPRHATRPTRASRERRLAAKRRRSEIKRDRRAPTA
jgi:ribosome-associated protein